MARKILQEKIVTNSEAQEILGKVKEEELGEFQRRTLDYARKFSKIPADKGERLVEELSSKLQLDRNDAIQIGFVSTDQLNGILEIMKRYV